MKKREKKKQLSSSSAPREGYVSCNKVSGRKSEGTVRLVRKEGRQKAVYPPVGKRGGLRRRGGGLLSSTYKSERARQVVGGKRVDHERYGGQVTGEPDKAD